MKVRCHYCAEMVDPNAPGVGREVTGWEKVRSEGGANSIVGRTETGRIACARHLSMIRQGLDPEAQAALL